MKELAEKVRFCVQSMCGVRWLTSLMPDDYSKRLVARPTFLYLDAFLQLAPRLKNELKGIKKDVLDVHECLRKLESDYEGNYSRIRDKLTAHRQELPLADLIEAWNEVDLVSTTIFTEDAETIYRLMADLHPDVPAYTEFKGVNDPAIARIVRTEFGDAPQGLQVGTDNLAITRPQTVTFIPTCDFQRQVMQVVGL